MKASRSPRVSGTAAECLWGLGPEARPQGLPVSAAPKRSFSPLNTHGLPAPSRLSTQMERSLRALWHPASLAPSAPHNHHQGRFLPTPRFPLNSGHSQLPPPRPCRPHGTLHVTPPPGGTFFPSHLKLVTFSGTFQIHVVVLTRIPWLPKPREHELF